MLQPFALAFVFLRNDPIYINFLPLAPRILPSSYVFWFRITDEENGQ